MRPLLDVLEAGQVLAGVLQVHHLVDHGVVHGRGLGQQGGDDGEGDGDGVRLAERRHHRHDGVGDPGDQERDADQHRHLVERRSSSTQSHCSALNTTLTSG